MTTILDTMSPATNDDADDDAVDDDCGDGVAVAAIDDSAQCYQISSVDSFCENKEEINLLVRVSRKSIKSFKCNLIC